MNVPYKLMATNEKLIKEIRSAALDMMARVKFDEKKHVYTALDDKWLQGISTVSSIVPKEWLSAWGAKEAVKALGYSDFEGDTERALEVLEKIRACKSVEEYQKILKDAKGASARKSKEALLDGTEGHAWLESYVKAKMRGQELPQIPEGLLERPCKQFVEWETEHIETWVLSEARVAYPEKGFAGTLDGLAIMKNGNPAVIDFKFASHISPEYYLQTAGYASTFEPYGIRITDRVIIRLPKTLTKDEWDSKTRKYKKVENTIEVQYVPTPYDMDRDTFIATLPVKAWINYVQNNLPK